MTDNIGPERPEPSYLLKRVRANAVAIAIRTEDLEQVADWDSPAVEAIRKHISALADNLGCIMGLSEDEAYLSQAKILDINSMRGDRFDPVMPMRRRNKDAEMKSDADNVVRIEFRLRDGRAVWTAEDHQQWCYEYFDDVSQTLGRDNTPHEIFPAMIRVMVEWIEATHGHSAETDLENVRVLADAVSDLTGCLRKCLASTAVTQR